MPDAKKKSSGTLAGDAYTLIHEAIRAGRFRPGDRLRFAELQALCGMSVTPVREALARLTAEGFTTLDNHKGYSVASLSLDELRDITAMRKLCESEALRLSILHGDDGWESRIIAAHHLMARLPRQRDDIPSVVRDDWDERHAAFHQALISACRSPILLEICEKLFTRADRYRRVSISVDLTRDVAAEHRTIMDRTLARDPEGAVEALCRHYQETANSLEQVLQAM
ncbi:MAG: hypothetical protein BGN83_17365 [Rhizobium sp. 63-7]|nr:MAG: hypothetical protein BGN83_17365 [Rhizobium sp. 63-7]